MRKSILAAFAGLLMLGGANVAQAEDKVVKVIMCGDPRPQDGAVAKEFEATNAGVKIEIESVPWGNCQDKAITLAAAGTPVGLSYMGARTLGQLSKNGLILPVDISEEQAKAYQPAVLKTVNFGGKYWGIPHAFSTKGLYLNCDVLGKAGVACEAPKTWDDVYNMAKAVKDKLGKDGVAGIGIPAKDFDNTMHGFLDWLYSNGGQVLDPATGEVKLDSPNTVETLKFMAKLADVAEDGPTAWERDQLKDLFNDGKIAMYVNGPWGFGGHKKEINQKVVPIPGGPSGKSGTILIADTIAVFKGSGVEDVAMKFAKAMTEPKAQYTLDQEWGLTPIFQYDKLGFKDLYFQDPAKPFWSVYVNAISGGGPEPVVTNFKSLQGVFTKMVQGAILKSDTPENLVKNAATELAKVK